MKTIDLLTQISDQIQSDPNLDDEVKDSTMELIGLVIADPSADNLRALAIVLEKLGDSVQYLSSLETLKNLEAGTAP